MARRTLPTRVNFSVYHCEELGIESILYVKSRDSPLTQSSRKLEETSGQIVGFAEITERQEQIDTEHIQIQAVGMTQLPAPRTISEPFYCTK